ncbi:hypothetical protein FHR86_003807 [Paenarthrobacter ilicis]|uniref:ATP-binding protein n=1 Tax=Paenarthrobacter ilicis TaxID=43665 RepID=A0ABX0TLI5_9MICC|nr:hypothetical protein [Paenarthrobacter ilicis]NIJ03448.1 hypothetical protein [Paenarthrobacter ilicis]
MNEMALHGRDSDRDAVTAMPAGFVLVVGDSGIGKSSFLSSLSSWPGKPLLSSPIVLKSVEGSVQTALADAISDCMSQYLTDEPDARTAWTVVKSIADRVKTVTGGEIGRAVLAGALAYAESKLGEDAVNIGKKVLGDVSKGGILGFDDQLASIRVPDRAKELCDIAAEFSLTVGRPIVLRLDNAERLAPSDQGLLAELVDVVEGEVWVVACVTPHHVAGDDIIQQVTTRGAKQHELLPLPHRGIEEWLSSAQVPPARWDTIARLSSGYPFFIADAIRLSDMDASLDEIAGPNGFEALMRVSWSNIRESLQEIAIKLAPFVDPPSEEFLLRYLGLDIVRWEILTGSLLESGIFILRPDGAAWFHDRRRAFIWERVISDKARKHVAGQAFAAVSSWVDGRSNFELWVPSATAVLARAAELSAAGSLTQDLLTLPDEGIALLWGLIEVIEPGSALAPFAEIGQVLRHAETRSGLAVDALATVTQLEAKGMITTREAEHARLVRSNVQQNTDYAALLGEIQLRFHTTPRPRLATAAFEGFIRPVMGSFDRAVVTLGRSSLAAHKDQVRMLRDPEVITSASDVIGLGATVTVDGQQLSFTAKFSDLETRDEAKRALLGIADVTARVQPDRVVPLPQPRLRYARYRLAAETLGLALAKTPSPTPKDIVNFLDLRAQYTKALGTISTSDEVEVLNLGEQRFLVDASKAPDSWTTFEVRTNSAQPTQEISGVVPDPHSPLLELQLRAGGLLAGGEHIIRTVARQGSQLTIPHPLAAVLDDIDTAGKKYNSGLRSVLFKPDAAMLEREIRAERQRLRSVIDALASAGIEGARDPQRSLLVGFWEDTESGWMSDFGNWTACALEVDDGQGAVVVRRLTRSPLQGYAWGTFAVPSVFPDHAGATATSLSRGIATSIIAPLLGYHDQDGHMTDLDTPLGQMLRGMYDIVGE